MVASFSIFFSGHVCCFLFCYQYPPLSIIYITTLYRMKKNSKVSFSHTAILGILNNIALVSATEARVPLWKSFSLVHNLKKLSSQHSSADGLDSINGIKVFSMFLIMMGHRMMFYIGSPTVNSDYVESVSGNPFQISSMMHSTQSVDDICILIFPYYGKRG